MYKCHVVPVKCPSWQCKECQVDYCRSCACDILPIFKHKMNTAMSDALYLKKPELPSLKEVFQQTGKKSSRAKGRFEGYCDYVVRLRGP